MSDWPNAWWSMTGQIAFCRGESIEKPKLNISHRPKMLSPGLYKQKYCLQNIGIFFFLLCWWVLGRRIMSDVGQNMRVAGFWILQHWYAFLMLQGVHCPSDLPSSFREALAFTSLVATSNLQVYAAKGGSEKWGRKAAAGFSMFQPQNPCPLLK